MGTFFCRHHRISPLRRPLSSSAAELTPKSERITQKRRRRCFAVKDNSLHGDHNHANAPPSRAKGAICLSQITSSLNNNHRGKNALQTSSQTATPSGYWNWKVPLLCTYTFLGS